MVTQEKYEKAREIIQEIKLICMYTDCKDCPFNTYDVPHNCFLEQKTLPNLFDLDLLQRPQPLFTKELLELIEAFGACFYPIEHIRVIDSQDKLAKGDIHYENNTRTLMVNLENTGKFRKFFTDCNSDKRYYDLKTINQEIYRYKSEQEVDDNATD